MTDIDEDTRRIVRKKKAIKVDYTQSKIYVTQSEKMRMKAVAEKFEKLLGLNRYGEGYRI